MTTVPTYTETFSAMLFRNFVPCTESRPLRETDSQPDRAIQLLHSSPFLTSRMAESTW